MHGLRTAAILFVLVLTSACATVSTINPIGIANGEVMDGALLGAWKFVPKDTVGKDEAAFAFVLSREPGKLAGLMIIPDDNEWWEAEVVVGQAGQYRMLNVKPLKKNDEPPEGSEKTDGYLPLRYEVAADGSINLFMWSEDSLKEAVQHGNISGGRSARMKSI